MKIEKHASIFVVIVLAAVVTVSGKDVIVPDNLAFILKNETWMTPDGRTAWRKKLRETPGITRPLLQLLWDCFDTPNEALNSVTNALMYRDDIPPAELKELSKRLRRLAEQGPVSQLGWEKRFLFGTLDLLQRVPNRENEDLALLLLECDDSQLRSRAARLLGWIGTERAVEPIRRHFDPFRYIKTDPPHEGAQVFEAEHMLLERVRGKSAVKMSSPEAPTPKSPSGNTSPNEILTSIAENRSLPKVVAFVTVIALAGLLWIFLKRRRDE